MHSARSQAKALHSKPYSCKNITVRAAKFDYQNKKKKKLIMRSGAFQNHIYYWIIPFDYLIRTFR